MVSLESLELGEALVDEPTALQTCKDVATKTGLHEKVAVSLVNSVGCRTLDDLEKVSEAVFVDQIIKSISDLPQPIVQGSLLKNWSRQCSKPATFHGLARSEAWSMMKIHCCQAQSCAGQRLCSMLGIKSG